MCMYRNIMENQSTIDKKKQQNKSHTVIVFRTKRQEYMRDKFKTDPEFRARSLANAQKWRESKKNAVIPEKNMKITDLDNFYLTCNIKQTS